MSWEANAARAAAAIDRQESERLRAEIERLRAKVTTARNTAKINLRVAKDRGEEIEQLRASLVQIRGFARVMDESNWRDLRLHIERQCDVLEQMLAMVASISPQAKDAVSRRDGASSDD